MKQQLIDKISRMLYSTLSRYDEDSDTMHDIIEDFEVEINKSFIINEDKLEELADEYSDQDIKDFQEDECWSPYADDIVCSAREVGTWKAFMEGYRKAIEG